MGNGAQNSKPPPHGGIHQCVGLNAPISGGLTGTVYTLTLMALCSTGLIMKKATSTGMW